MFRSPTQILSLGGTTLVVAFATTLTAFDAYAANSCASVDTNPVQCGNGNSTNTWACRNGSGEWVGVICETDPGGEYMSIPDCCSGIYDADNFNTAEEFIVKECHASCAETCGNPGIVDPPSCQPGGADCGNGTPPPMPDCDWKLESHGTTEAWMSAQLGEGCTVNFDVREYRAYCFANPVCSWIPESATYYCSADHDEYVCEEDNEPPAHGAGGVRTDTT